MSYTITVENIKCGGCANSIRTKLLATAAVCEVAVDVAGGRVHIEGDEARRGEVALTLARLGYPEVGSVEGLKAAAAKAKSFVSCAVGRMDSTRSE